MPYQSDHHIKVLGCANTIRHEQPRLIIAQRHSADQLARLAKAREYWTAFRQHLGAAAAAHTAYAGLVRRASGDLTNEISPNHQALCDLQRDTVQAFRAAIDDPDRDMYLSLARDAIGKSAASTNKTSAHILGMREQYDTLDLGMTARTQLLVDIETSAQTDEPTLDNQLSRAHAIGVLYGEQPHTLHMAVSALETYVGRT